MLFFQVRKGQFTVILLPYRNHHGIFYEKVELSSLSDRHEVYVFVYP